jgi:hypothetical protein
MWPDPGGRISRARIVPNRKFSMCFEVSLTHATLQGERGREEPLSSSPISNVPEELVNAFVCKNT